jgi:hypothetical protein
METYETHDFSTPSEYIYSPDNMPKQAQLLARIAGAWMLFGHNYHEKYESIAHHLKTSYTTIVKTFFGYKNDDSDLGAKCVYTNRLDSRWYGSNNEVLFSRGKPTEHCLSFGNKCKYIDECPLRRAVLFEDVWQGQLHEAHYETPREITGIETYALLKEFNIRSYLNKIVIAHQKADNLAHYDEMGGCVMYNPETTQYEIVNYDHTSVNMLEPSTSNSKKIARLMEKGWLMLTEMHLQPMEPLKSANDEIDPNPLAPSPSDLVSSVINHNLHLNGRTHPLNIIFNVIGDSKIRMLIYQLNNDSAKLTKTQLKHLSIELLQPGMHNLDLVERMRSQGIQTSFCDFDLSAIDNKGLENVLAGFKVLT